MKLVQVLTAPGIYAIGFNSSLCFSFCFVSR